MELFIDAQFHTQSNILTLITDIQVQCIESGVLHFGQLKNVKSFSLVHMIGQFEFGIIKLHLESNAS